MISFYDAWYWLVNHPINTSNGLYMGMYGLDIHVVNPILGDTEVWLEFGPYVNVNDPDFADFGPNWQRTHDPKLDCGGATFETAIIMLYHLVMAYYGEYEKEK